jgi:hypothetical protein
MTPTLELEAFHPFTHTNQTQTTPDDGSNYDGRIKGHRQNVYYTVAHRVKMMRASAEEEAPIDWPQDRSELFVVMRWSTFLVGIVRS